MDFNNKTVVVFFGFNQQKKTTNKHWDLANKKWDLTKKTRDLTNQNWEIEDFSNVFWGYKPKNIGIYSHQ